MSRFYISELIVTGPKVRDSRLAFADGVNIIHGPSNTGKSYVIGCIDFILGGDEIPFTMGSTGYDTVIVRLMTRDGETARMERKIIEGKNGETGAGTVRVESPFDEIPDGELNIKKKEYSDFLLRLMGITKRTQIISNEDYDLNDLTFRSIIHFFFIDESSILTKKTVFTSSKFSRINASLMALLFLLTGNNYSAFVPSESKDERERKAAQKAGVINYLNGKIKELKEKRDQADRRSRCHARHRYRAEDGGHTAGDRIYRQSDSKSKYQKPRLAGKNLWNQCKAGGSPASARSI